jgi:hypothetical protein
MTGMSRRERMISLAQRMKLEFSASISDDDLQKLIRRQPATKRQRTILADFLKSQPGNRTLPADLSYGKACELTQQLMEFMNERAIERLGLVAGRIISWCGTYYYVVVVTPAVRRRRVQLRPVTLWRGKGAPRAQYAPTSGSVREANPADLVYDGASIVDLTVWRLRDRGQPSPVPDDFEPPF